MDSRPSEHVEEQAVCVEHADVFINSKSMGDQKMKKTLILAIDIISIFQLATS